MQTTILEHTVDKYESQIWGPSYSVVSRTMEAIKRAEAMDERIKMRLRQLDERCNKIQAEIESLRK